MLVGTEWFRLLIFCIIKWDFKREIKKTAWLLVASICFHYCIPLVHLQMVIMHQIVCTQFIENCRESTYTWCFNWIQSELTFKFHIQPTTSKKMWKVNNIFLLVFFSLFCFCLVGRKGVSIHIFMVGFSYYY